MWDVGVRYGKAIHTAKQAVLKDFETASKDAEIHKRRKPPRPHVRCAHWQRYHVGKGRTEIRVNWVPPVIVCGTTSIPVTIHALKK